MEFFLSIREAGGSLREVALPESGVVRIGRELPAEIVCADGFLSRVHAEIERKGMVFTVRDLDSRNGTLVNGVRVPESVLFHGDTVLAGRTCLRLTVKIDGKQVPGLLSEAPRLPVWQQAIVAKLRETCGFAVLDGARNLDVLDLLKRGGAWFQSLYEGREAVDLAPQGPYLVELVSVPELLPYMMERAWGNAWGVYVGTHASFEELRRHLRRFLTITGEDEQKMLFRFYDPRVLRTFLPTCTAGERAEFFGPVERFAVETAVEGEVLALTRTGEERIGCKT